MSTTAMPSLLSCLSSFSWQQLPFALVCDEQSLTHIILVLIITQLLTDRVPSALLQTSNLARVQQKPQVASAFAVPAATCKRQHVRSQSRSCTQAVQRDMYSSNLGVLQPVVEQPISPAEDPYAMQRVSPDSFSSRGYYLDGSAIFGSLVLLVILLALTFQRILGLDRLVNQAIQKWRESRQYERRNEVIKARQALKDSWDGDDNK